jgi:hypothetical protein
VKVALPPCPRIGDDLLMDSCSLHLHNFHETYLTSSTTTRAPEVSDDLCPKHKSLTLPCDDHWSFV